MRIGMLPGGGGGGGTSEASALQVDAVSEISALTEKAALATGDYFLIEDFEDNEEKKYATLGSIRAAVGTKWAQLKLSVDQATVDESGPDLLTGIDTIVTGSTGHGITVNAGVISLPANTTGYKWRLRAGLGVTSSATGSANFSWTENPSGSPPVAAGNGAVMAMFDIAASVAYVGAAAEAIHYVSGTASVGVICTFTSSTNTCTIIAAASKIFIDEVKA